MLILKCSKCSGFADIDKGQVMYRDKKGKFLCPKCADKLESLNNA